MATPTKEIIEAAIDGLEARKQRIDSQIAELRAMLTATPAVAPATVPAKGARGGKRKFSAATLKRMREGQQRRWAKVKGTSEPKTATKKAAEPKRKMSAAGKANIVAALKKRWAAKKAAGNK